MRKRLLWVVIVWGLIWATPLQAGQPADRIADYIDKVLQVFQDPEVCGTDCAGSSELKQRLSQLGSEIFDFEIMSRMSLARHWKKLTDKEQQEFVHLFTRLLEDNYFGKIVKHFQKIQQYSKDKVRIVGETVFSSRKAEVKSLLEHNDKKIPVDYRMVYRDTNWSIYDVYVEGVSLIGNYRKQFNDILFDESPRQMLQSLREKLEHTPGSSL